MIKLWAKYIISIVLILLISIFGWAVGNRLYDRIFGYYITAKFFDLAPLTQGLPVFYKGCKIGKAEKVELSKDYKYTNVKIILYIKKDLLPKNITAIVKRPDTFKNYIELIYPDHSSKEFLTNGSVIKGSTEMTLNEFLTDLADSGIKDNITNALTSIKDTSDEMGAFFTLFNLVLEESRDNIKRTTKNAAQITTNLNQVSKTSTQIADNLNQVSSNLKGSIKQENIKSTISNIEKSSATIQDAANNVKSITKNIDNATKDLDKTVAKIDTTIDDVGDTAANAKAITCGVSEVLRQRFAGLRIFFGNPMRCNICPNKCRNSCCNKNQCKRYIKHKASF